MDTQTLRVQAEDLWIEKYRAAMAAAPEEDSRGINLRTIFDRACRVVTSYSRKILNQVTGMRMSRLRTTVLRTMRDPESESVSRRPPASAGDVEHSRVVS